MNKKLIIPILLIISVSFISYFNIFKNAVVPKPIITPITVARKTHLSILIKRTAGSSILLYIVRRNNMCKRINPNILHCEYTFCFHAFFK